MSAPIERLRDATRFAVDDAAESVGRPPVLAFYFVVDDADDIVAARRIDEACAKYGVCCALHPHMRDEEPTEIERDGDLIVGSVRLPSDWKIAHVGITRPGPVDEETILEIIRHATINALQKEKQQ